MGAHIFSFYVPSLSAGDTAVEIAGDEHRHLKRVLRLRPGDAVRVTNGTGVRVSATLEAIGDSVSTARVDRVESSAPPARRLVLALPLLQRAHFDAAVSQCVELGITELVPVHAERCHVRVWSPSLRTRIERVAVSAMKQSGGAWLPPVREPVDVDGLAGLVAGFALAVVGDAGGAAPAVGGAGTDTLAIVGPEGGFSDREIERLTGAGVRRVSLSVNRLRAETAAVVLVALLARATRVDGEN
ncbi:MAG TPA: RsmE family RNA methyltransferase [Candidatus Krumholzibacteria bacterium]|nr:RsmE family RNA methyltransferase [Candidatus Krumholzibacteria bacterium]